MQEEEMIAIQPSEEERVSDNTPTENTHPAYIEIDDEAGLRFYGNDEQRAALMDAYTQYIGEVQNPKTTKFNPFTKSNYAPLDEVLNATRPVLSKYGLAVLQAPLNGDGNHVYVKTMLLHKSGGMVIFPAFTSQKRAIRLHIVVLPAPEGPTMAVVVFSGIEKLTWSKIFRVE